MRRLAVAALAAAVVLGAGCRSKTSAAAITTLRQPSSLAIFRGFVADRSPPTAPGELRDYLVVANATRNDLTLLDASDDTPVESSILLRPLVLPVEDRPSLLAAAKLADKQADLLVAVSAGDSVLQVVETWTPANAVHSKPDETPQRAVDPGCPQGIGPCASSSGVVAMVALAPDTTAAPSTARIAVALADDRIAIVTWTRQPDGSIAQPTVVQGGPFAFQPLDLAVVPDDPQSEIYAATIDPLAGGVFGVAAISQDLALTSVRALDARGPTRFVDALRLRERAGTSTADDGTAFNDALETRVYAVLDVSGCGGDKRIDCGIVSLDPSPGVAGIPPDWAGRMPYRSPMRFPGRASAFAVSGPPSVPPAESPDYAGKYMRLHDGSTARHTTGVAAVSTEDGSIYFFDLGRFESATNGSPVAARNAGTPTSSPLTPPDQKAPLTFSRLWLVTPGGGFASSTPATDGTTEAQKAITITPGWTPPEAFLVQWQGFLPGLTNRFGEAGLNGADLWVTMQTGEGAPADGRAVTSVVRLFHPALGVHPNDIVAIKAAGVPGCAGTAPEETRTTPTTTPGNNTANEFEMKVADLLPPNGTYPGGALHVTALVSGLPGFTADTDPWTVCFNRLQELAARGAATRLDVSIRASGLLLRGANLGYAGRPEFGVRYNLEYPSGPEKEDPLAAQCPIADWDGTTPVDFTCGGTGCPRSPTSACEKVVLARKARRVQNISWECSAVRPTDTTPSCQELFNTDPGESPIEFPQMNGPIIGFKVEVQPCGGGDASTCTDAVVAPPAPPAQRAISRGSQLSLSVSGGVSPLSTRPVSGTSVATGAISFDRSPLNVEAGYRFLISYPSDIVIDVTPSLTPVSSFVVR